MNRPYLEVTFRRNLPVAAYLYLPRKSTDHVATSEPLGDDFVIDRNIDGRPIGIELLAPASTSRQRLNEVLVGLHLPEIAEAELAPLHAA
jgi:uncharacterized protein YuzE